MIKKGSKIVPIAASLALGFIGIKLASNKIRQWQLQKTNACNQSEQINISIPYMSNKQPNFDKIEEIQQKTKQQKPSQSLDSNSQQIIKQQQDCYKQQAISSQQIGESSNNEQKEKQSQLNNTNFISNLNNVNNIADIPEFNLMYKLPDDQFAIVIVDMPYTPKFQQEILNKIRNTLKSRKSNRQAKIYRLKVDSQKTLKTVKQIHGAELKQQTILLLKNPYEQNHNMINFNFDMFVQYPHLVNIYLSDLHVVNQQNYQKIFIEKLKEMPDNQSFLLMLTNSEKNDELEKKKLTAKYIQMELGLHKLQGLKMFLIDDKIAKSLGILKNPKSSSLHLIRKNNQFTYATPNRWILDNQPFHVLENVNLYDKKKQIMLPKYLSKIQTFNSMNINAPYVCSVVIDRNKIQPWEQQKILKIFADLKKKQTFPFMSYVLKFAEIQYAGKDQQQFKNTKWMVKVANLQKIDRQILVHEAHTHQDLDKIGISQDKWQKHSYQYLYRYPQITLNNLTEFINNVLQEKQSQFFKTQKRIKLQNLNRLTGQTFDDQVTNNLQKNSHLVFQYSDHCSSCQMLSPGMQYLADVFKLFPDLNTTFHAINCDKNRIQGQPYSPYTPNLYFYSKNWKNKWPLKYPILDFMNQTGIKGIYDFCQISDQLKKIDTDSFNKHIKIVREANVRIQEFIE